MHGNGNLGDDGHRHMYALSPWIESRASVSLYFAQAALAAEPASLITTARGTMDARAAVPDTTVTLTPQISP